MGFGSEVAAVLNSGEIAEVKEIPEISKDLVELVTVAGFKKEIKNGD